MYLSNMLIAVVISAFCYYTHILTHLTILSPNDPFYEFDIRLHKMI